jgi:hypothetical protein
MVLPGSLPFDPPQLFQLPSGGEGATVVRRLTDRRSTLFAEIYKFPLRATSRARGARGSGHLHLAQSPFGIALTADGHLKYDLEVTVSGLRKPSAGVYVAWITTPELDRTEKLGSVMASGTYTYRVSTMNKFILLISLEASEEVEKRSGPTLLRGISPSGLMQNMESHELFSTMPHD